HQFVTGSLRSESEEISVGGSDNVDAYVFDPFDYVALGSYSLAAKLWCGAYSLLRNTVEIFLFRKQKTASR
ncbi:MAG: hypothetical protein ACLUNZ_05305, partial [Evtepia sp.]